MQRLTSICLLLAQEPVPVDLTGAANDVARWLTTAAIETDDGLLWPGEEGDEPSGPPTLYSGSSGVVLFFVEAHARTGHEAYLETARRGADALAAWVESDGPKAQLGLYTGLAGVGYALGEAWRRTGDEDHRAAAMRCVGLLEERAEKTGHGVRWNDSTDLISGSAGIGLWLLDAAERLDHESALALAVRAGDELLAKARAGDGGLWWPMDTRFPRVMPNLSHGTAGVGLFLARLYEETGDARFLAGAVAAAAHLRSIATEVAEGARLVHHSSPGGEDLFYLGWCHGPTGTVRFLDLLARVSGDATWGQFAEELVAGLRAHDLVAERPPGFWDNVGQCCGTAGVAEFFLRRGRVDGEAGEPELCDPLLRDLLARGTRDGAGLRWTHCEHRVRPDLRSTQTGYMQGAAGIGLFLLHLDAYREGAAPFVTLPDDALGSN